MTSLVRLDSPLRLACGATLANRILKSAMTEGLADAQDRPTGRLFELYRRWAEGGAGTLVTGNVMVDRRYLERPGNVVVEDESAIPLLSEWVREGSASGNHLWMQINHPGRQCTRFVASEPVAPSEVQLRLGGLFGKPRALKVDEIVDIIGRFARVAGIAKKAGFTGVQIHSAHGYLSSQFLSPWTNSRTDKWGGPLENRARFVRETVRAVRREVGPDYPVAVKLNSSDFQKGGFSLEDSACVAGWLVEDGIDLLEISGGTYEHPRLLGAGHEEGQAAGTKKREAYFLEYAAAIRTAARVPLAVTGGFRSRALMDQALADGLLDVIGLARPLCAEPDVARRLILGQDAARDDEKSLTLGNGFVGPKSPNGTIRALNTQAQTAWFYQQIIHLAEGRKPELGLSAAVALGRHYRRELRVARARRKERAE